MESQCNGYYDIDVTLDMKSLAEGCMLDDYFYLQDLQQRKLFLNTDIEASTVADIVKHIMQFNAEDKGINLEQRRPILLYLTSNGGEVDAGFELIDVITNSKTPVYTINLGYQYSMGFLIGLSGHKRYATSNAKFLMHDGAHFVYNSGTKAQDQMQYYQRVEGRIKDYIIEHSSLTLEEYDSKIRVEWYLFADEAKDKGFVDYIIGKDCDIDDII